MNRRQFAAATASAIVAPRANAAQLTARQIVERITTKLAATRNPNSTRDTFKCGDPDTPVTLSRRFLTGILREELGFAGVAVSDDIGMGAMKGVFDSPESAVGLIESGCDMVMVCAHFTGTGRARGFAQAILAAIEEGRLDAGLLARSRARIENLLARVPSNEVELLPESVFRAHANAGPLFEAATVEVV